MPNSTISFLLGRRRIWTSVDLKTKGCTIVYSFRRGCKTIKAACVNWTEQCFIPCVFDSRCLLKNLPFYPKNLVYNENWDCDQYYLQQMSWKHLNKALLHKLHHQIQTAYIHYLYVTLVKLIFAHKIKANLNHGTCIRARDFGSENAI